MALLTTEEQLACLKVMIVDFVAAVVKRDEEGTKSGFETLCGVTRAILKDAQIDRAADETAELIAKLKERA